MRAMFILLAFAAAPAIAQYNVTAGKTSTPCPKQTPRTVVIVILGQSNAANSAEERHQSRAINWFDGRCYLASDPMLGASGDGGSVWPLVASSLLERHDQVILVPLAIAGSPIVRWSSGGDLAARMQRALDQLGNQGYRPTHVLWHQGESDAGRTGRIVYAAALADVILMVKARAPAAGFWIAKASRCAKTQADLGIQEAQRTFLSQDRRIYAGPDADAMFEKGDRQADACHFAAAGQRRLAAEWVKAVSLP